MLPELNNLKIALVHDWLVSFGGAERVLGCMHEMFPDAPIYTALYAAGNLPVAYRQWDIRPSFLQKIPGAVNHHRQMLPLMPIAFEQLNLSDYDLVICSSHACSKGVITAPKTCQVSYIHTPMRYAWDMRHEYMRDSLTGRWKHSIIAPLLHYLRIWDQVSTARNDSLACNSRFVARRIWKYYRREATVIHPPVHVPKILEKRKRENFFLMVSRLVSYKRIDLAVHAFNRLGLPLKIVGNGPHGADLRGMVQGDIEFLGAVNETRLHELYQTCQALVFPGLEDFGIVPLEAQARGTPVIAYGCGGVLESVLEEDTGLFFQEQTIESLMEVMIRFQKMTFDSERIYAHATQFGEDIFKARFQAFLKNALREHSIQKL